MVSSLKNNVIKISLITCTSVALSTGSIVAMETHKVTVENCLNHKIKITQLERYRDRVTKKSMLCPTSYTIKPHTKKLLSIPSKKDKAELTFLLPDYYRPLIIVKMKEKEETLIVKKESEKSSGIVIATPTQEIAWTYPV